MYNTCLFMIWINSISRMFLCLECVYYQQHFYWDTCWKLTHPVWEYLICGNSVTGMKIVSVFKVFIFYFIYVVTCSGHCLNIPRLSWKSESPAYEAVRGFPCSWIYEYQVYTVLFYCLVSWGKKQKHNWKLYNCYITWLR